MFNIRLENKQILVVIGNDYQQQNDAGVIKKLLPSNANLTVASSKPPSKHLESFIVTGEVGLINREVEPEECRNYHWIILVGNNNEIVKYCKHSRIWITVLDDPIISDIEFTFEKLGMEIVESDSDSSSISECESLVSETTLNGTNEKSGTLYLVGVGPGSPDLLTIRAQKLLQTCPVIISDRLVCKEIFENIPSKSRLLFTRKVCGKANMAQNEINNWIVEHLQQGQDVLRIKGGDPFVFGRGGEEWNLVRQLGYKVELVPGISSCISAPGLAGIPVTQRGVADSFVVATGQKEDGTWSGVPKYSSTRTLVLLMSIGVLDKLQSNLMKYHDYPADIPVAVIYRASWPDQQVIRGSLKDIAQKVKDSGINNHSTVIIGNVVDYLLK
ncbi:uroporphyrin-III C-methyltransferase [Boothiomyces macroporosus]|uniref:uroporphyrinogen-III C-methyltransferase n=1 Tax=Boothiomyces macroporosus TaxID=261099 RepID=A0AAD5UEW9_9FUNG|nr:uroporphyrin-III C-methyltransferase [Boothiomyces macroporosus]